MKQSFYRAFTTVAKSAAVGVAAFGALLVGQGVSRADSFLSRLQTPDISVSTVPKNGDVNPYGVAFVPDGLFENKLHPGDILVSNFNNSLNLQGTGTTIDNISADGHVTPFFAGSKGLGLSTALGILRRGFVIVGNVPSTDGTSSTVGQGSLLILNSNGHLVETLTDPTFLDGPWDLTVADYGVFAQVFVSNVLNGTVSRLDFVVFDNQAPQLVAKTIIASGYTHRGDPNAFEIGPTGLVLDKEKDILYVASTGDNAVYAVPDAQVRTTPESLGDLVYQDDAHLRGPLGLVIAPNGDFIATNGDAINGDPNFPSELVEFTPAGDFVAQVPVDSGGQGGAFGIAIQENRNGRREDTRFAAVDDVINFLDVWNLRERE